MNAALEELLGTLLFEGYALYPYTPGATKNATPTPFGIVYPPAYAEQTPSTFDKLRMQGVAHADGGAVLSGEVRFLQGAGEGHQAVPRRLDAAGRTLADLAATPHVEPFEIGSVHGRVRMSAEDLGEGRWRVMLCVHNTTPVAEGLDRPGALGHSLLSTHPVLTIEGGRFVSPLEAPEAESVNTFPVLATEDDDALLGAAIMLPDHPRLAPESRGDLFDGTEIEEALLLHVLALSDDEREAIAAADPAVQGDGRPRRRRDPRGRHGPARAHDALRPRAAARRAARASARSRSTASPTGWAPRPCCASATAATPTTGSSTGAWPRSSASTSTTRTSSTSGSRSTTTPARS